jgi:copper chaperone
MITFRVPDMTCGHCASVITMAVAGVDKSARIKVNIPVKLVSITSTAGEGELMAAIREAGYAPQKLAPTPERPTPRTSGCCCASRKSASVDASQIPAPASSACCG